jgi:hypothetical protein
MIGPYRLERLIDDTGRSQVWIAHDDRLDRNVALKVRELATASEAAAERERFAHAARIAARVEHPGVIAVFESGATESLAYLAMRYVPGRDLELWLEGNQKASVETRFQILSPIAEALDHAHTMGIAHGSVSPANIIVDESTTPPRGALAQFGRAREATETSAHSSRDIEADRLAFAQVLTVTLGGSSLPADALSGAHSACVDLLRKATAHRSSDPSQTPATVVRTRRALPRHRRLAVFATAAVTILIVSVGALELLQDGAAVVSSEKNTGGAIPIASTADTEGTTSNVPTGAVLVLGTDFTSHFGAWSKQNRKPEFRMRKGVTAADVIETALLANPATAQLNTLVVPLKGSQAKCRSAAQDAIESSKFRAIIVLESPCTVTIARLLVANEASLPPTYWIDLGNQDEDPWAFMASAPPVGDKVPAYASGTEKLASIIGAHSGENFARLRPGANYLDVGTLAKDSNLSDAPCFYLAARDWKREDSTAEYAGFEDFRIASSIVELAVGFGVPPSEIRVGEIIQPRNNSDRFIVPSNGTLTGSMSDDARILEEIRSADTGCILVELPAAQSTWSLRVVEKLAKEFPGVSLVQVAHPGDPYAPGPMWPTREIAAFTKVMQHPKVYSLSQAPYVSLDAPLGAHADSVTDSLYEEVDYDRPEWWFVDDYALVLVAELIGAQPPDRGDGRPGFGRLNASLWATPEEDFITDSSPVEVDAETRVYGGYLVHVYHGGELFDTFYGGAAK